MIITNVHNRSDYFTGSQLYKGRTLTAQAKTSFDVLKAITNQMKTYCDHCKCDHGMDDICILDIPF